MASTRCVVSTDWHGFTNSRHNRYVYLQSHSVFWTRNWFVLSCHKPTPGLGEPARTYCILNILWIQPTDTRSLKNPLAISEKQNAVSPKRIISPPYIDWTLLFDAVDMVSSIHCTCFHRYRAVRSTHNQAHSNAHWVQKVWLVIVLWLADRLTDAWPSSIAPTSSSGFWWCGLSTPDSLLGETTLRAANKGIHVSWSKLTVLWSSLLLS